MYARPLFCQVRDSKITSYQSNRSRTRKDVTIAWNEPIAAAFIGQHIPAEHLMYILEIDPPIDKHPEDDITMMPACNVGCSIENNLYSIVKSKSQLNFYLNI